MFLVDFLLSLFDYFASVCTFFSFRQSVLMGLCLCSLLLLYIGELMKFVRSFVHVYKRSGDFTDVIYAVILMSATLHASDK